MCRVWASEQQGKEWIERPNFTFALSSIDNVAHACTRLICFVRLFFSHHRIFFPFLVLSSIFFCSRIFFTVTNKQSTIFHPYPCSPSIVMTSSSPTPDIGSLSLSSQPPHQRLHETYDFDGTGINVRPPYHFATSPPVPPSQSPFHPLSMNQSPLKTKTSRAGLPSVRSLFFLTLIGIFPLISYISICTLPIAMARWRCYYYLP